MSSAVISLRRTRFIGKGPVEAVRAKYENIVYGYIARIESAIQAEIASPKWPLAGPTTRWSGGRRVVEGFANIIDSGTLYDSFYITESPGRYGTSVALQSSVPYVNAIRFGYRSERSKDSPATGPFKPRQIPGRDFLAVALAQNRWGSYLTEYSGRSINVALDRQRTSPVRAQVTYDDVFGL